MAAVPAAFTIYFCVLALVNNAMAGWNFYFYEAIAVPFEITALNLVLTFWRDDIFVFAICAGCIVAYG